MRPLLQLSIVNDFSSRGGIYGKIAQIAEGMGVESRTVEKPTELQGAFEWAFSQQKPTLVDVSIAG